MLWVAQVSSPSDWLRVELEVLGADVVSVDGSPLRGSSIVPDSERATSAVGAATHGSVHMLRGFLHPDPLPSKPGPLLEASSKGTQFHLGNAWPEVTSTYTGQMTTYILNTRRPASK